VGPMANTGLRVPTKAGEDSGPSVPHRGPELDLAWAQGPGRRGKDSSQTVNVSPWAWSLVHSRCSAHAGCLTIAQMEFSSIGTSGLLAGVHRATRVPQTLVYTVVTLCWEWPLTDREPGTTTLPTLEWDSNKMRALCCHLKVPTGAAPGGNGLLEHPLLASSALVPQPLLSLLGSGLCFRGAQTMS
jgi:hypothetical protein